MAPVRVPQQSRSRALVARVLQSAAELFASEGAKVVIGDVRDELSRQTADAINAKVANSVRAIHLDVTRAADWRSAVETCTREFGGLDLSEPAALLPALAVVHCHLGDPVDH